jgi:hypothetical protein
MYQKRLEASLKRKAAELGYELTPKAAKKKQKTEKKERNSFF